ncbi:aspartate kinase [Aureibaculum sp. 2210JD6-5]|uniref:aspartate kinase n=1 Tax=Aureibaculum sp. 2210JD6-5 TaxID=3103957 RepID=UPI002AACC474|nr:aspartate kinase [Aureibaculum sp. 2210JD6-5]MDY7396420.1 aspartate kinase [Aureibaculum sp. 2210JD6-5]
MKIFKFGGASIKDTAGVKNLVRVLNQVGYQNVLIVISAMGKMTNAFEKIADAYFYKKEELPLLIKEVRDYHYSIANELFKNRNHTVFSEIEMLFIRMSGFMIQNKSTDRNFVYDQIVSVAELISTKIVSNYLNELQIENTWVDVRELIKTNSDYRDAKVNWQLTEQIIAKKINPKKLYVTQGFISQDSYGNTTTLGREGSDYTAGIFAYCLNAKSLTIWKDVDGVLNADPRYFKKTQLLEQISYTEAIELAFYGASVIHPKTLQPLQKKEIPLYVKSFFNPKNKGTYVSRGKHIVPEIPCFIVKKNQLLLSISSIDFSFVVEQNISEIFGLLHLYKIKVNLIQNSAISFSICMEDNYNMFQELLTELSNKYKVVYLKGVSLYTIRHFNEEAIKEMELNNKVLLKQSTKETTQIVVQ